MIEVKTRIMQQGFIFRARSWNSHMSVKKSIKKLVVTIEVTSRAHNPTTIQI
jgi:ribosomal protein S2